MKHSIRSLLVGATLILAIATVAQGQTIHAVTETTSFSYLQDDKVAGPATEVVELSLSQAGLNDYQVHLYPWARSYDMALKEPNVLIYLIARTPAREAQFQWAGEIIKIQYHFYKLKNRPLKVSGLDDLRGYTIGVMRNDVRHEYLKKRGLTRLVVSAQQEDNYRRLLDGRVDLLPLPERDAAYLCQIKPVSCDRLEKALTLDDMSTSLYMAYSLGTPEAIVTQTRAAFEALKASGVVKGIMEKMH
jgi:polar amino acid transport system substrate-binding protein